MMKIAWASDLHFDDCNDVSIQAFLQELQESNADIVLFGGDISNGILLSQHLRMLDQSLPCTGYFVLGNHDYYYRSLKGVGKQIGSLQHNWSKLNYLTSRSFVSLNNRVALIGQDGWSDAMAGTFDSTPITIQDFNYIQDFKNLNRNELKTKLRELGHNEAASLKLKVKAAFQDHDHLVILMHPPAYEAAAIYKGASDPFWLPYMVWSAAGDMLKEVLANEKKKDILILCGHAHSYYDNYILPNLRIIVSDALEKTPKLQPEIVL